MPMSRSVSLPVAGTVRAGHLAPAVEDLRGTFAGAPLAVKVHCRASDGTTFEGLTGGIGGGGFFIESSAPLKQGTELSLEFSLPDNRVIRAAYLFYFRYILPKLGSMISGDRVAYNYLNKTVETFPYGASFCALMSDAGFSDVQAVPLTFGIATIYRGDKR